MSPKDAENKQKRFQFILKVKLIAGVIGLCWRGRGRGLRILLQGEAPPLPCTEPSSQWPDAQDALSSQEQRHTGAGGLVWSSAVEDDVAIALNLFLLLFQLVEVHSKRAGNRQRLRLKLY